MKRLVTLSAIILLLVLPVDLHSMLDGAPAPPLDEEIVITEWHVVGPFLNGPREPLANPLSRSFNPVTGEINLADRYPSVQAFGGEVGWTETSIDEEGNLVFNFDGPDWDKINDEWGISGVYFMAGAYSTFECSGTFRALVNAHGIGSFYINGVRYSGDPYGHRLIKTPVILNEGANRVFFITGGFAGSDTVRFDIEPPPAEALMVLERDILLPDFVRGESLSTHAGIPVVNTTDAWIRCVTVSVGGDDIFGPRFDYVIEEIPPLCVIKAPVEIATLGPFPDLWEEDQVEVPITLTWADEELVVTANARVRDPEDSRRIIFISDMDESAQKYSVRYPTNYDPSREYALILGLHGAGVECDGKVNSFEPRDWAFIVAPTNRRRFGFDWQDWGRLDVLEVMDECFENYPIDPNRVYLVGHSMGGHGTWHVGCTHADRFAAIVPSAGWASFQLYVPWFLRMDEMFSDPDCSRIFEQATSPDRTERLLPNLRNTPVLAVHGGNDDNVPPTHARLLTGFLERMDYDVGYWEEPGEGHWWDSDPNLPGAHCVDALRIRSFLKERERDPYPRRLTLATYDLGNASSRYWVRVDEDISPIGQVRVDAELCRDGVLRCSTMNVRRITFDFGPGFPYAVPRKIEIDGQALESNPTDGGQVVLANADGTWELGGEVRSGLIKTPEFRGPIKRAYFDPFVIVVGTIGAEEENLLNMEIARGISQRWWYRANGYAQIIRDVDAVREFAPSGKNFILVGGPESNAVSAEIVHEMPIGPVDGGVRLGDEFIPGDDLAIRFVYPQSEDPQRLMLAIWGTSLEGMRLAGGLTCMYSGSNQPDFLVFDDDTRLMGYAGVRAAGYFDNDWELDAEYYYLRR